MSKLKLHPHHGACIQNYVGNGYSDGFNVAMRGLIDNIRSGEVSDLILSCEADILCESCPNCRQGVCISQEKVAKIDKGYLNATGCAEGGTIACGEYFARVRKLLNNTEAFQSICGECEWFSLCSRVTNEKNQCKETILK